MASDKVENCWTCPIVKQYVDTAFEFTQSAAGVLLEPMYLLFGTIAGLWIVIQGLRLIFNTTTWDDIFKQSIFVFIAAILLGGQGPKLASAVFEVSLATMGSAAAVALEVRGERKEIQRIRSNGGSVPFEAGMLALVGAAEEGIGGVIKTGWSLMSDTAWHDLRPKILAIVMIVPYFLVLIVYFSQVMVSIFRVMMIAVLSPFLMLGFGFGWGRGMVTAGVRTVLSSFMILFGATAALAVMVFAVGDLKIGEYLAKLDTVPSEELYSGKFLLAVAMGWLGTAFIAEATRIANSITGSVLDNSAAAIVTAGAVGTAAGVWRYGRHTFWSGSEAGWGSRAAGRGIGAAGRGVAGTGRVARDQVAAVKQRIFKTANKASGP